MLVIKPILKMFAKDTNIWVQNFDYLILQCKSPTFSIERG